MNLHTHRWMQRITRVAQFLMELAFVVATCCLWGAATGTSAPLLLPVLCYSICFLAIESHMYRRDCRADQVFRETLHTLLCFFVLLALVSWDAYCPCTRPFVLVGLAVCLLIAVYLLRSLLFHLLRRHYSRHQPDDDSTQTKAPLTFTVNRLLKRTFDLTCSILLLLTVFPVIFLLMAIVSKIKYHGPVLFRRYQTDSRQQKYWHYSFGLSRHYAWVQRMHLNAWAELINVCFGNLSVVGRPQPETAHQDDEPATLAIHQPKYGIVNWQTHMRMVLGDAFTPDWYTEHWSLTLDLFILLHTCLPFGSRTGEADTVSEC